MEDPGDSVQREFGPQPLDSLLNELGLSNRDLVDVSDEQLTHKQVQRARKGRRLTKNMQEKISRAVAAAIASREIERAVAPTDLFNYRP